MYSTNSLFKGCHACEIACTAKIGFDNDNEFSDAQLIDLIPMPNNNPAPAAAAFS